MLSNAVYQDLTLLVRYFSLIRQRIDQGAQPPEIDLLIQAAGDALHRLAATIGAVDAGEVGRLARHLQFIGYYFGRGDPDGYAQDIEDITQRDLPGVIDLVSKWEEELLSPGLVEAVSSSWRDRNYVNVVRDAFVYLEEALRSAGRVPTSEGLSADQLVNRLLGPDSPQRIDVSGAGPYSPRTGGEQQGAMLLFKGSFLLFRNAAAHRFIDYNAEQADELLRLVNLCLRIIGTEAAPQLTLRLPAAQITPQSLRQIELVLQAHPGPSAVYLVPIGGDEAGRLRLGNQFRVQVTAELENELKALSLAIEVE